MSTYEKSDYIFFLISLLMMFLIGLYDDIKKIKPIKKLILQIFISIFLFMGQTLIIYRYLAL